VVKRLACVLVVAMGLVLPATPVMGQWEGPADELLYAVLPVTPEQVRELTTLLRSPSAIAVDVAETTGAVVETAPKLPGALLHDVVTTPVRHWHLLRGVVTDTVELVAPPPGEPRGLFRHTLRALHRSQTFTAAAGVLRRVTQPTNRTARLAIVLTARAHGVPMQAGHLDMLQRAIDRDDPDLGPLVMAIVETLARMYGRDAVRLLLTAG
jgi:hypothetical protein